MLRIIPYGPDSSPTQRVIQLNGMLTHPLFHPPALRMNQGPQEESLVILASHMHFAGHADAHSILENIPASAKQRLT